MKQQEVFKKTGAIIKELNEQYEYLQSTVDNLNDLELELFVANTHFLKDHAEILRKLNLQKAQLQHTLPPHVEEKKLDLQKPAELRPEPVKPVIVEIKRPSTYEPKYFEPLVHQARPVIERTLFKPEKPVEQKPLQIEITPVEDKQPTPHVDLSSGNGKDSYTFEREEPEIIKHHLILDETDDRDEEDEAPVVLPEKKEVSKTNAVTMENILDGEIINTDDETQEPNIVPTNPEPVIDNALKVKEEEPAPAPAPTPEPVKETKPLSFNERMSAQLKGNQVATSLEPVEAPIKDIKAAISLNDKLLFVKDLFNGYSLAYSEAIEIVNRFANFEEADRFLKTNYVTKNNWEGKKATMDKFYALLKRRYT
ncbi:hypothetical protein NAF17_01095 [Mucilaginibacter sp. RB4R14]|uniref:hypothetical protein n=1 Tax=Mucilaginibacter aurantiaciroseus TaxID=2949308 RepID=UPI002090051A|nr:hypothetical protein [Mucilaginibacter aurantiaciroseus]MCO5934121.1 hypothetical protein [Mucilaginibacter aurantiaciroseus]